MPNKCLKGSRQETHETMNDRTFEIKEMTEEEVSLRNKLAELAPEEGNWVPLHENEASELRGMNRAQRRAWLKKQRKAGKR